MIKMIFVCLFLALSFWACNDECHIGGVGPCSKPFKFGECPSEKFLNPKACHPICEAGEMITVALSPDSCEFVDCFTLECISAGGETALVDIERFPMDRVVIISLDGGEPIEAGCFIIVADACV